MKRLYYLTAVFCALCIAAPSSYGSGGPVTYHLAFDDFAFLEDCYVAQSKLKTPEERRLELVGGRFGKALFLGSKPLIMDDDNMSGIDLDLVTAVIYNVAMAQRKGTGYDEPFIWGAGRLHPACGAVAFWAKGPLRTEALFNQSSSAFGRKEKELVEVRLEEDGSLSAYVEDARYVRHTVRTKPLWKPDTWMHIVFQWDRSSGVSLWVNGREAASAESAWWENQRPGLFHLPMAMAAYDEFYLFARPLAPGEIAKLHRDNAPPDSGDALSAGHDGAALLRRAFCADPSGLPVLRPSVSGALVYRQVTPERIHDEGVSGWWLSDGRHECAWPHEYALFTVVPGDADYHADHADILPPKGAVVNYITLEGNLTGLTVLRGDRDGSFSERPVIVAPDEGFFHGTTIDGLGDAELRLPFTTGYGTPPDFEGEGILLPLSGDVRVHEAGLFNVGFTHPQSVPGERKFHIDPTPPVFEPDGRYRRSIDALLPVTDRRCAGLYENIPFSRRGSIVLAPMTRLNLVTAPFAGRFDIEAAVIELWAVPSASGDNILSVSMSNPAVPSQRWTHAEARLEGFSGKPQRIAIALEFDPVILMGGDRFLLDIFASDGMEIITGDPEHPSTVTLRPCIDTVRAVRAFSFRTMQPAIMTYSKMFEYMPWRITGQFPDVDRPDNFGGPFDMVYPWQAVLKAAPGDRVANIYRELVMRRFDSNQYPPKDMTFPDVSRAGAPPNAPDWAVQYRDFQTKRENIIAWYRHHQRSDGQVGGGWNDDTLVFSSDHGREGGYSDMILDSYPDALTLYNNVFDGFDRSGLFRDGYCRIHPIDRLHNGDFVRERYKSLIYNPGDPRSAVWAMEEAWHLDKPDETLVNYGDGTAFMFGKNVLEWYWGRKRVEEPYVLDDEGREEILGALRLAASSFTDTVLWRFTEARVHTDDQSPCGSHVMHRLLDGGFGVRESGGVYYTQVTITLGLGWPEGGGADLARFVEYSGNDGFTVRLYSFDSFDRDVTARLYRLDKGEYSVTVKVDDDNDGVFEKTAYERRENLRRFGTLTFAVPPKVNAILEVRQTRRDTEPADMPDLAVSGYYLRREGRSLVATVHNIGSAPSGAFDVTLLDSSGGEVKTVRASSLDAPVDYVPRSAEIRFDGVSPEEPYRVVIDRNDTIMEIFEENNEVVSAAVDN